MTTTSEGPDQRGAVRLQAVAKLFTPQLPPVFTRKQRIGRLWYMLRDVFGRRPNGDGDADVVSPAVALADVSVDIAPGTVLGVVGDSGCGKTTLLRMIAGLLRPTSGRVMVAGRVAGVFALPEGPYHRRLSVRETITLAGTRLRLGRRWIADTLARAATLVGLEAALDAPLGAISGQSYRKLAWTLAVSASPDVLVLDDLFLDFEPPLAEECQREIESRSRAGATVILAASSLTALVPLCTHVLRLSQGRVVNLCPPGELLAVLAAQSLSPHAAASGKATPADLATSSETPDDPRVRRDWYWIASRKEGWATYVFLHPAEVRRRLDRGHALVRATPPWVNSRGECPFEPWHASADTAPQPVPSADDEEPDFA